ncbi:hypothetical protein DFH28DRAFT_880479 [Melampsora americana]|nr:hypothetical protein DFH28DRAFT_880479 [Melampsora americana]
MEPCICDNVCLWGGRIGSEVQGDCWICKYLVIPQNQPYADGSDCTSDSSVTRVPVARKTTLHTPASIREHHRLESYWCETEKWKAQRELKVLIQNKRRNNFASLREALYLIHTYRGPFLQSPRDKRKAAQYLRRMGFGAMFVSIADHEVKWKWLEGMVRASDEEPIPHH